MSKIKAVPERQLNVTVPKEVKNNFDSKVKASGLKTKYVVTRLLELFNNKTISL